MTETKNNSAKLSAFEIERVCHKKSEKFQVPENILILLSTLNDVKKILSN